MRRLLGVLRSDRDAADLTPQPQLTDLSDLVSTARRSGISVQLADDSDPSEVPPAVGLTAYRIVQEALSNASRHAAGAPVDIKLQQSPGTLRIRVRNAAPPGAPPVQGPCVVRHGLTGMRERVAMLAGTLTAEPTPDGGFEAVSRARELRTAGTPVDVLLMDVRMPVLDGLAARRQLLTDSASNSEPPTRVLVLTTFDLDEYVYEALRAGASGFLLKDAAAADLVPAVRVVAAGDALLAPSVTR